MTDFLHAQGVFKHAYKNGAVVQYFYMKMLFPLIKQLQHSAQYDMNCGTTTKN